VLSNETGNYSFQLVPVGNYEGKIEAQGFKAEAVKGLRVETAAHGQREIHQVVSIDGVDAKDLRIHITNFVPSIEAIEEFKIETNAYSASVGFGGGAVVSITMKSGTNQLHGTLFEFLRNDKMDAEDYFLNFEPAPGQARKAKNSLRRNQFGAVVSGPLIKNRTFWAFNWESRRERVADVREAARPLDEFREGNFSVLAKWTVNPATGRLFRPPILIYDPTSGMPFADNIIPRTRLHPGIVNTVLPKYVPRALSRPVDPLDVNTRLSIVQPIDINTYFGRVDHYFSDSNRVFGRIAVDRSRQDIIDLNPEFPRINDNKVENLATQRVHTFNQNMINEIRFGFNRSNGGTSTPRQNSDFDVDSLGIGQYRVFNDGNRKFTPLETGIPTLGVGGIGDGGEFNQLDTYQMGSHLSWIKGNHNLKLGGEYYYITIQRAAGSNGEVSFSPLQTGYAFASFLKGLPNQTRTALGWPFTYPVAGRQGYYVNDDWKISPRLTLNLGFRFDYNGKFARHEGPAAGARFSGQVFRQQSGRGLSHARGAHDPDHVS
jgi:hypothetical protein